MLPSLHFVTRQWFRVLAVGTVLFFGVEQALKSTGNLGLAAPALLLGAFVVPAAVFVYFYGEERGMDRLLHGRPFGAANASFFAGGAVGVVVAGTIEYATLASLSIPNLFGVGLVEEAAKLIFPVLIFIRARYRSEADGLLFGVGSGMGFAALETAGYGLTALVGYHGSIGAMQDVLLVRGLMSPVGHGAWTGLVCAALWHERERTGRPFNIAVIGMFAVAVVLHTLWNVASSASSLFIVYPAYAILGGISLTLLVRRLDEARRPNPKKSGVILGLDE